MAKSYNISFRPEIDDKIFDLAAAARKTNRQWIIDLVEAEVKKNEEVLKVFEVKEYVFRMKDGSFKQASGKNPGAAWQELGYAPAQAEELMAAYKTLMEARTAGWVPTPESTPGFVAPVVSTPQSRRVILPPIPQEVLDEADQKASSDDDLPFGS